MSLPWIVWSILANLAFVGLEYSYRSKMFPDYIHSLPLMIPLMVAANYFLFNVYRTSPTFLSGWAVLSFGNVLCRFVTNWLLGEALHIQTVWGIIVMLVGMVLIRLA